jgi:hypothetical protein
MIYDEEVQDPTSEDAIKLRKRIRSLMFPKRVKISKTIPQLLEESNLALQYGRRRRQVDGQSVTSRIYRSFPIREEPKGTNMQENSEVTWDKTTSPELNERLPHLQKETAKLVEKVPHQGENKATQKWNEYREAVALSLANLIYFGVIINESEPVKISMIRMRSPSKKMGTKTAIERMISAKLLDHKIGDDDSISPELIVAMDLFNSHRDLLQGSRQKQAIDIIRNLIRPSLDIWDKYMSGQEI